MTTITLSLLFIHLLKRTWKDGRVKWNVFGKSFYTSLSVKIPVVNQIFLGQIQANPIAWNFPRLEIVIFKNNFAWHFSNRDYLISRSDPGTLPHLKNVFWDKSERFLVFLFTSITKISIFNMAGFLNPSLDCDEFSL